METVQDRIRKARKERRWNQTELGARLDYPVAHPAISRIETGVQRLTLDMILDLARALDVPVSWMLEPILD